jgi:ATP-dependent Lhr-like helicase
VARTVWEKLPTAPVGDREDPLGRVLVLWLKAYGPLPQARLGELWGLSSERLAEAVAHWTAEERWVVGDLGEGVEGAAPAAAEVCDARNLETLLRMLRAASRVAFEAQPLDALPLFLAVHQGVVRGDGAGRRTGADGDLGDLKQAMEPLFGYPAPAAAWEGDLLPARLRPYHASWLDRLFVESDLVWFGVGAERLSFALAEDLDLFASGGAAPELFDGVHGRLSFEDLVERSGLGPADLVEELWGLAWEGRVSSTTFLPVRQGLLQRFRPPAGAASRRRPRPLERGSDRWQGRRSSAGEWFALPAGNGPEPGLLERVELDKLRVRQLLSRYGVLFRELSQRELPELAWGRLFRALRLMELSGEVVSGQFFEGVPGLQFASHRALATLKAGLPEDAVFWLNALDPASPCGLGLEGGRGELPPRLPGVHLVFHGRRRVLVSRRSGAELTAEVSPDHPDLPAYLEVLKVLLTREFQPLRALTVETVNGDPAAASPYAPVLAAHFSVTRELDRLRLRRRY